MAKLKADQFHAEDLEELLGKRDDLAHLRVRRRGDLLTLESGPADDPVRHARFRRISVREWALEMPTHTGRWEPTGVHGRLNAVLGTLADDFGWALTPIA